MVMKAYSGSKRTFTALLRNMLDKDKIAIVLALVRKNATPIFAALLPQVPDRHRLRPRSEYFL
jgi:ATP-dependent DNA helicase 2 subunit 1